VVTQSLRDLAGNPTGEVILSQSVWKLVMEQEPEEVDKIVAQGVMTKFAHDAFFNKLIKDIKTKKRSYSEILICGEGGYEAVRLYVDRFTSALFSTDGAERDVVFKMMRDGISPIDAVNHVIGDTKYKRQKWLKEIIEQMRGFDNLTDGEIMRELHEAMND
jgi:conjugal transfer ATP-binding protein TraC